MTKVNKLRWEQESSTRYSGFCDGAKWADVYFTYDNGWAYGTDFTESGEYEIEDGFFTAQQAMNFAESAYDEWEQEHEVEDDEPLSYEEAMEVLGDILYEARRDDPDYF